MSGLERWRGKVAVVTGASSGIGREVARRLSEEGLQLVLAARGVAALEELAVQLPGRVLVAPTDLREEEEILRLFERAREELGGVDLLVNNAGLGYAAPLLSGPVEAWREMLEVNVLALCLCAREAVADMRRRGVEGQVINISSMAAHRVPPGSGVYSATKYAVRSLTEGLRLELHEAGLPIRVASISPGFVETGFAANYHGSEERARETYTRYKVLEADDVASAVLYLLGAPPHVEVHDILMRPKDQPN